MIIIVFRVPSIQNAFYFGKKKIFVTKQFDVLQIFF